MRGMEYPLNFLLLQVQKFESLSLQSWQCHLTVTYILGGMEYPLIDNYFNKLLLLHLFI